jgi:hypothetical protein
MALLPIPAGQIRASGVPLAAPPPYVTPQAPTAPAAPQIVPGAATRGSGTGQYPQLAPQGTFTPNLVAGSAPGQLGPFAVLQPNLAALPRALVVLPPPVGQLLQTYPDIGRALALLDGLLARMDSWSAAGARTCGQIARALDLFLGAVQFMAQGFGTMVPDQAIFLWRTRQTVRAAWLLFTTRAGEATGPSAPNLTAAAQATLAATLALPPGTLPALSSLGDLSGGVSVS